MFKAYQEYNQFKEEWFKNIPAHWNITRLQNVLSERNEKNSPIKETNILSLSMYQGVVPISDKQGNGGNKPKENLENYKISYPNDIVLNSMNIIVGSVGLNQYTGLISPAYYALYNKNAENNIYYWNYIFKSNIFQKSLFALGKGILFKESENGKMNTIRIKVSMDSLNKVYLPFPPKQEQTQIATFLDQETQKIDHLISKQERLIELLEEQRKSIISYAVTKGINPNAEMKDSGVEWLGEVPKDWELKPFNSLYKRVKITNKPNEMLLSIYREYGVIPKESRDDNHNVASEDLSPYQFVDINYLVVNKMKAWQGSLAISTYKGIISPAYFIYEPTHNYYHKYIHYLMRSIFYIQTYKNISKGIRVGQWDLDDYQFNRIKILVPPLEEQQNIVNYIEQENTKINNLIEKQTALIEKLKEYRSSIISHTVTGKIDVRRVCEP
nr:restriction endonuclease subunit S [uncultured Haemophilus sp.]